MELKLESLEDRRKGVEIVAVQVVRRPEEPATQFATVFVPDGALKHFVTRFEQYAEERTSKGEPRHKDMVDRIAALRRASLRALWTDDPEVYPAAGESIWWEVWLRRHDGRELERMLEFATLVQLTVGERRLAFDDRLIVLARGTAEQLSGSIDVLNDVAEVRKAKESAAFFVDAGPHEQAAWTDNLKQRTILPSPEAPAVCILDTGVNRGHPLLEDVIGPNDATAVDPTWGAHDDGGGLDNMGHGTEMAGLAAYGDLADVLASGAPTRLWHWVESVKILPPTGTNPPELYGAVTAQAVSRPEVNMPGRPRAFSLAVTSIDERDRGEPTSWSAAIDALAAGRTFDPASHGLVYLDPAEAEAHRLFVVSAGNVSGDRLDVAHLDRSDVEPAHDPAQAWNALTVGAYTEKAVLTEPAWKGWSPLTPPGDPFHSRRRGRSSQTWCSKAEMWPTMGPGWRFRSPYLSLVSTYYKPAERSFVLSCATSAAAAQVAHMAGIIRADYPELSPESVRALIVHSAEWTRAMQARLRGAGGKRARAKLVRRYGFGVPNLDHALRSAGDALTLVVQAEIRPFADGKMREMHLHQLPWPKEVLEELGQAFVRLRVTLSYFIEPNPGRRGWTRRHRYASHGLRFEVKSPTETIDDFRKSLNKRALEEEEGKPATGGDSSGWFLGEQTRFKGSIHSDTWSGTAVDLAERGVIGVYPVSGWWKDQPKRDRTQFGARYALVVGISTEAQEVAIWTPVAQQIGVPIQETVLEV